MNVPAKGIVTAPVRLVTIEGEAGVKTGASLTSVTMSDAVSVARLKADGPPLLAVLTLVPAAPLVVSHAQ